MALKSKSKVAELSGIPWATRKPRTPKAKIPWLEPKKVTSTDHKTAPAHSCGEIDLIMAQGSTAIIVEVRLRNNNRHGSALESVSTHKQARVSRCAKLWWVQKGQRQFKHLRFDVVALEHGTEPKWVQNAWQISN